MTNISKYIDHCHEAGQFLEQSIPVSSAEEVVAGANELRTSERWVVGFANKSDRRLWESIQAQVAEEPSKKMRAGLIEH